jgi:polysaccharide export outer membrane protein
MKFNLANACRGAVSGLLLLTLLSAGCSSPDNDPGLTDNPNSPAMTGSPTTGGGSTKEDFARFHVGDTVTVTISGLPEADAPQPHQEVIKDDGTITLPEIGKVVALGKTDGELQNAIHDAYVPQYYTHLTVTVNTGDRVYYVRGEVKNPDRFIYVGEVTITKAIAAAGDFTDFANRRHVVLIRSNGQHIVVNCNKILKGGAPDLPVYPGDQIFVSKSIW